MGFSSSFLSRIGQVSAGISALNQLRKRCFFDLVGESEVNNGGFSQYFLNSSGETAGFVVEALETIGAPNTADICRRAIAIAFPDELPSDSVRSARRHPIFRMKWRKSWTH